MSAQIKRVSHKPPHDERPADVELFEAMALEEYEAARVEAFEEVLLQEYEEARAEEALAAQLEDYLANGIGWTAPEKKIIRIGVEMLLQNMTDAIEALAKDATLYQRAGELVRIVRITELEERSASDVKDKGILFAGTPMMRQVPEANLLTRMCALVPCERWNEKEQDYVRCDPPAKLIRAVLTAVEYPMIRVLRGVAETPFLRPDGSVCQTPGYDRMTGYLYAPRWVFPTVPNHPSQDEAHAAFQQLWHVYAGLDFVDDNARACPIAGILTIFAQAAIQGCVPIFMTEANTPGTGKTLTSDTIGIIASGRPMPRRSFPGPGDELRKVLDSYARDGTRFFCLDNIGQDFGGEALEAAVTTEGHYDLRILGETRNIRVEWKTIIFGTGNNIGFCRADIIPRTLMSRMETQAEDPRGRDVSTFLIKENLLDYVKRNQTALAVAALTVLRAFTFAGRPEQGHKPWGSFAAFADLIADAILFAGGPDITTCRLAGDKARSVDTDAQHLAMVLERLPALYERGQHSWMTAGSIITALYDVYGGDVSYAPLRAAMEGLCSKKQTGQIRPTAHGLAKAFQKYRTMVVGGKRLVSEYDNALEAHLWQVEQL
jgi:hypothetical protein